MKSNTIIILSLIFFCISNVAAMRYPGYYINKNNLKVTVDFEVKTSRMTGDIDYMKIQKKIKYYDANNKLQTLLPEMTSEFAVKIYNEPTVFLSRVNTVGAGSIFSKSIFLQRVRDGRLKLFKVYEKKTTPGFYNSTNNLMLGGSVETIEKFILQKDDRELLMTNMITFRKKVSEYLSDCPDLVFKIQNKLLNMHDMVRIVEEYNTDCK